MAAYVCICPPASGLSAYRTRVPHPHSIPSHRHRCTAIAPWHGRLPDRCLKSDCDEELLIHIVFVQKVRLSGLQIKAPAGSGPKSVKLIVNTPSLDFDSAKSTKVTQEVALTQEGVVGNAKVELKLPLFSSVGEVTLLIEGNHADEEETVITSLALWGEMIEITGKRNDNPHLGKWSEDSGVEKYEKAASR